MDRNEPQTSESDAVTRRDFLRDSAAGAAGLAVGLGAVAAHDAHAADDAAIRKTRGYNPEMEYRRLGKTGIWVSAVCLGGHWKRIDEAVPGVYKNKSWLSADLENDAFQKNRHDVVARCLERGINYIDACTREEVVAYSRAVKDKRDQVFFGFSWYQEEMRNPKFRTSKALLATLDKGMQAAKLEYVDLWRIVMDETSSRHTQAEIDEMMDALTKAKQQGKTRFTGLSSHDRPHIKWMIETYPEVVQVVVMPYTARSKELPKDSVFEAIRKHDVGCLGIKPFASNSLFAGIGEPGDAHAEENDRKARLAIRYILCNPAVTAPIPGLINTRQVDNMAQAVKERRKLDKAEAKELEDAMDRAWADLPRDYQWLKDWEYV
ncbi:MAG: aldo/keto reductase [Phycisphaerae bacterium]|nr:aldo/keto reductase [Phycisphaerae bacterium]